MAVFAWMRGEMTYMKGSTGVTTNAEQAWNQRQGVCQDLAHLAIGSLRSCGIPARYVSGYLHPRSTAELGETVAGPVARVARMVGRRMAQLGPDQPQTGRGLPRHRGPGPRLPRRAAAQGHPVRRRGIGPQRQRGDHPRRLTARRAPRCAIRSGCSEALRAARSESARGVWGRGLFEAGAGGVVQRRPPGHAGGTTLNRRPVTVSGVIRTKCSFFPACHGNSNRPTVSRTSWGFCTGAAWPLMTTLQATAGVRVDAVGLQRHRRVAGGRLQLGALRGPEHQRAVVHLVVDREDVGMVVHPDRQPADGDAAQQPPAFVVVEVFDSVGLVLWLVTARVRFSTHAGERTRPG